MPFKFFIFKAFKKSQAHCLKNLWNDWKKLKGNPSESALKEFETSGVYIEILEKYEKCVKWMQNGSHGATPQFWMQYIDLVGLYLNFRRAIRTNDIELFIHSLDEMCKVFFATSHPNYARFMVLYTLKLMNLEITHPGCKEIP